MVVENRALKYVAVAIMISIVLVPLFIVLMRLGGRTPDYAVHAEQAGQFRSIQYALEYFAEEYGQFPPSDANDPIGKPYDGAMKLCEALMGRDLLGFHTDSVFRSDGMDSTGTTQLYKGASPDMNPSLRMGPFLGGGEARVFNVTQIYGVDHTGSSHAASSSVLTDTYVRKRRSNIKCGMPILYYRARKSCVLTERGDLALLFNYSDNYRLTTLGMPGTTGRHPLSTDRTLLYDIIWRTHLRSGQPRILYEYVLISAGWDGLYGTLDDVCLLGPKH